MTRRIEDLPEHLRAEAQRQIRYQDARAGNAFVSVPGRPGSASEFPVNWGKIDGVVPQQADLDIGAAVRGARRSKYGAKPITIDGHKFPSRKEGRYYMELCARKAAKDLAWFGLQTTFILPGGVVYIADFVVKELDGRTRIIDVKGMQTPAFRIKRKLMKSEWGVDVELA